MEEEEAQEVELEEEENEDLNSPRSSKQFKKHRIVRDFDNEAVIKGAFTLAEHQYEALRKEAFKGRVTMGHLVREAIALYLGRSEAEEKEEAESEIGPQFEEAVKLVMSCNKRDLFGFVGFEIAGEDGFIARLEASGLDSAAWENDDLLKGLAERLAIGYNQWFLNPPDPNELLERISNAMGISDEKRVVFIKAFSSALGIENEAESIEG